MAKYAHPDVLDGGLLAVKNGVTKMMLLKAYTFGDSLAVVNGNKVSEVAMTAADLVITTSGNNRVLTVAAKSAAASAIGGVGDHHIVLVDATRVLVVTDETGEAAVAVSDTTNFPAWTYTAPAPV